jgi:hypothetical protein
MTWPQFYCSYVDSHGCCCNQVAAKRIHFSTEHPFDHMDLCLTHLEEYKTWVWCEVLVDGRVH